MPTTAARNFRGFTCFKQAAKAALTSASFGRSKSDGKAGLSVLLVVEFDAQRCLGLLESTPFLVEVPRPGVCSHEHDNPTFRTHEATQSWLQNSSKGGIAKWYAWHRLRLGYRRSCTVAFGARCEATASLGRSLGRHLECPEHLDQTAEGAVDELRFVALSGGCRSSCRRCTWCGRSRIRNAHFGDALKTSHVYECHATKHSAWRSRCNC